MSLPSLSVCSAHESLLLGIAAWLDWGGDVVGGGVETYCKICCAADSAGNVCTRRQLSGAKACIANIGWPDDGGGKVPLATDDVGSTGCTSGWPDGWLQLGGPLATAGVATVGSTCGSTGWDSE